MIVPTEWNPAVQSGWLCLKAVFIQPAMIRICVCATKNETDGLAAIHLQK
jgi:hypothetical protein